MRLLVIGPDTPGLATTELLSYLEERGIAHDVVKHPIAPVPRRRVSWLNGRRIPREQQRLGPLSYLIDLGLTVAPVLDNLPGYYDYAICVTPHLALAGLLLRQRRKVKKVVYWALDYYPRRYGEGGKVGGGKLGNLAESFYRRLERKVIRDSDILWAVTNVMQEGWRESNYTWTAPFRKVPNTIQERFEPLEWRDRQEALIWSGTAREGEGLELVSENWEYLQARLEERGRALPSLTITCRTKFPDKFDRFIQRPEVTFRGFIPDMQEVRDLAQSHLASLATYSIPSYKRYSDASRVKMALSLGLPSIVSGIEELGAEVQEWGAGEQIPYRKESLARAIETLLDRRENMKASWAAYELAGEYLASKVFSSELRFLEEAL